MSAEDIPDDDTNDDGEEDDVKARKRKERLEQNRISARESRKRKKTMIEELQRTVITLSRENKDLNERNENLRRQLMEIGAKYPNVVPLQAIVGQGAATASEGGAGGGASGSGGGPSGGTTSTGTANPLSSLNPMNWIGGGGGNAGGGSTNAGDSEASGGASNQNAVV